MKKLITLMMALTLFSLPAFSDEDFGWRHLNFQSQETTKFSLDIKLKSYIYSEGTAYVTDTWVHVSDYMVSEAKAVILNYNEGRPVEVKEFDLTHNNATKQFEAPAPYGFAALDRNSHQELAIRINGNHWLKVPGTDLSNFSFDIFKEFNIR